MVDSSWFIPQLYMAHFLIQKACVGGWTCINFQFKDDKKLGWLHMTHLTTNPLSNLIVNAGNWLIVGSWITWPPSYNFSNWDGMTVHTTAWTSGVKLGIQYCSLRTVPKCIMRPPLQSGHTNLVPD